ncbi:MAG: S8 family serine peptidase, partial [Planctomycetota bacterium]|nr:S8 family serine peptidase [Planctomycetota bacterium]
MQNLLPLGALALVSPLALAQDQESFRPFVERPGMLEFSGVLCARPLQLEQALERGLTRAQAEALYQDALALLEGLSVQRRVEATDEYLIDLGPGATENEVASQLLRTGAFQYVEPDWICYPVDCPNDNQFSGQWQHVNMESCAGWDLETGDPNVVVAICDTGIQVGHPDLQLHRREGFNAPSNTWENSGGDISPVHPHGTMVTGCAAANGDNGIGVAGVGWNLGHRMMRVTDDPGGGASLSNLTNAARTAIEAGDKVANVSYSGVASGSVETTGAYIRSLGSLLVWSGGNSSENHQFSRDDSVIIVGASDSSDNKTSWS